MNARRGFALVLMMCVAAALSILMLRMYARASLLLQTVVERERDIKMNYATEALMLYAVRMAKHNWSYLLKYTALGEQSEHHFVWDIDGVKKSPATCVYKAVGKERLGVEALLEPDVGRAVKISCELHRGKGDGVVIDMWKRE